MRVTLDIDDDEAAPETISTLSTAVPSLRIEQCHQEHRYCVSRYVQYKKDGYISSYH